MKIKISIVLLFVCACYNIQAQTSLYNKTQDFYSNFDAYEDILTFGGDSILAEGFLVDISNHRFRNFSFLNSNTGDTLSSFTYARDSMDSYGGLGSNIIIKENIIYFCGALYDGQTYPNFLKLSIDGDLLLDTMYNPTIAYSRFDCILPTDDDNFLLLGVKEANIGNLDVWLVKMDPYGTILWEHTYGGSEINGASIIEKINDGNYIISSSKETTNGSDIYILKVDGNGAVIWEKIIDNTPLYESVNCQSLVNGDFILTGYQQFANNKYQAWISRIDQDGNLLWDNFFEKSTVPSGVNAFFKALELNNGNLIVIGQVSHINEAFNPKGTIYCFSAQGDSLWSRYLKIRNNDNYLTDLKLLDNGDYLMCGYVFQDAPDNTEDGWIMRTNCLGYFEHPIDSLVFTDNGTQLEVLNLSSYFEYTIIDWGDGSEDTLYDGNLTSNTHSYLIPGNYTVTTTTVACNDTIQNTQNYIAHPTNLTEQFLSIFPNPTNGNFQVWLQSENLYKLSVLDASGRLVFEQSNILLNTGYNIDLTHLDSAIYIVNVQSEEESYTERILIKK